MRKFFMVAIVLVAILFVGCGHSFYPTDNHNFVTTNVNLSDDNFRVVGIAEGKASATYVLGIGGLSKRALRSNAYTEMIKNANLVGSQMVVNATIEQKIRGFFPFVVVTAVKYQGVVIEFNDK